MRDEASDQFFDRIAKPNTGFEPGVKFELLYHETTSISLAVSGFSKRLNPQSFAPSNDRDRGISVPRSVISYLLTVVDDGRRV